jgi:hypothetical protein
MFQADINTCKQILSQKSKPNTMSMPKYAGAGHSIRFIRYRLEKQMMVGARTVI